MSDIASIGIRIESTGARQTRSELDQLTRTSTQTEKGFKNMQSSTERAEKAMGRMTGASNLARKALGLLGGAFAGIGIKNAVGQMAEFEASLSKIRAITRSSVGDMRDLERAARELGATTSFSAAEAAEGMSFLGMAGFNTSQIIKAMPATLSLARAGALDLGRAADIASNAMSGFGLEAEQMGVVADTLAAASSRANTDVQQLGDALSYAAPIASSLGVSIQTTSAAIGVLSDAGLQGSRAGTGLSGVFRQLTNVTTEGGKVLGQYGLTMDDVNVKSHGFEQVLGLLAKQGMSTGDIMRLFGAEAGVAATILLSTSGRVSELTDELNKAEGAAAEAAKAMGDNLKGDMDILSSSVSELILLTNEKTGLTGTLRSMTQAVSGGVSAFGEMIKSGNTTAQVLGAVATTVAIVGAGVASFTALIYGARIAMVAFNLVVMANPLLLLAAGATAAGVAIWQLIGAQDRQIKSAQEVLKQAQESAGGYVAAKEREVEINNLLERLHRDEIKTQTELDALREKGFKKYGNDANRANELENKLLETQNKRKGIIESRIAAEKAESARREKSDADTLRMTNAQAAAEKAAADAAAFRTKITGELNEVKVKSVKLTKEEIAENKLLNELMLAGEAVTRRVMTATERHADEQKRLNELLDAGTISTETFRRAMIANDESLRDSSKTIEKIIEQANPFQKAWENAIDRIDGTFIDLFKSAFKGFKDFTESLKSTFKNLLAELAYMAVKNKIMISIGMGGSAGGLLGSVMGGGGGGGGGGSSIASIAQIGKQVYSAFTGWGQAAYAGFQTGGFGGAISGAGGYFGDMFSGVASTVGGWFGGGAAAAGSSGTGFGLGGTLVSGEIGSASYAASNAMAGFTNSITAMAGPMAGIAGALKGYEKSGIKGAIAGGAGGYGGAVLGGAAFKAIGGALGGPIGIAVGSVLGGVLGGSLGSKLFGGSWKTKGQGIELGASGGQVQGNTYEYMKKKGGLFGKNKKKTKYGALDSGVMADFQDVFDASKDQVIELYRALGYGVEQGALDGISIARRQISTMGRSSSAINADITAWFNDAAEAMSRSVKNGLGVEHDYTIKELSEMAVNMVAVNSVLERLNVSSITASVAGAEFATQLAEMAGGLDELGKKADYYYETFFTREEQLANLTKSVKDEFDALYRVMPETHEEFRAIVESLDLNTAAGRNAYTVLMNLAPAFDAVANAAKDAKLAVANQSMALQLRMMELLGQESELLAMNREAELEAMDESLRPFQERLWAIEDEASAMLDSANAQAAYIQQLESVNNAVKGAMGGISSWIDKLKATGGSPTSNISASAEQFQRQLELAQGGDFGALQSITQYADRYLQAGKDMYASGDQYQSIEQSVIAALEGLQSKDPYEYLAQEVKDAFKEQSDDLGTRLDDILESNKGMTDGVSRLEGEIVKQLEALKQQRLDVEQDLRDAKLAERDRLVALANQDMAHLQKAQDASYGALQNAQNTKANHEYAAATSGVDEWRRGNAKRHIDENPWFSQAQLVQESHKHKWTNAQYDYASNYLASIRAGEAVGAAQGDINQRAAEMAALQKRIDELNSQQFATGGAFTNGIVTRATDFNMGTMGEAGPEAIMPLANIGGSLGVRVADGGNAEELQEMKQQNKLLEANIKVLQAGFNALIEKLDVSNENLDDMNRNTRLAGA